MKSSAVYVNVLEMKIKDISLSSILLVILLLFCTNIYVVDAIYQSPYTFSSKNGLTTIDSFGFLQGGYFDFNYKIVDGDFFENTTQLLVCTDHQYNDLESSTYCLVQPTCYQVFQFTNSSGTISYKIDRKFGDYFTFLIGQCSPTNQRITYKISYAFYNPGGNHLSYQYIPLPYIYMIFTGVWVILTILWCINWYLNRKQNIKLHKVISLLPFSKLAVVAYYCGYWTYLQTYGAVGIVVIIFFWLFYIVFRVIACVVLLTIATGWGICSGRYEHLKKPLALIIILLGVTIALGAILQGFFNFLQFIVYIPVLCIIFIKTDFNINLIRASILELHSNTQMQPIAGSQQQQQQQQQQEAEVTLKHEVLDPPTVQQPPNNNSDSSNDNSSNNNNNSNVATGAPESSVVQVRDQDNALKLSQLQSKLMMFTAFKWIMLAYLSSVIVIQFLASAFQLVWIFELLSLLIDVALFVCIGLTFRLRKEKMYYEFMDEE
ncbi:hypothetical protein PPL_07130 [Heterostelium album PN500]|uniref:Transmembrane protein n=1 Tax=Heterostelium pallidum (strain ATCC 26659 / Pp 5 / PN500) TaxID=670386 RepID=D3BEG9_HETP5|nr:hypothetical protein PPL_07130 [Heterostelium album PN500]EFA80300.1 hypothetical protein PPL_07130 [Heterostelium album PN500]|eukprot:XP_020432420.1 hypothetical protein PPL_07130 [Heterostelium album PN500]